MTTPIDTIITHFETKAREVRERSHKEGLAHESKIHLQGKADGYEAAANFLKDLKKLFN